MKGEEGHVKTKQRRNPGADQREGPPSVDLRPRLSPRQRQVMDLLVQGLKYLAIAAELRISERTVRHHTEAVRHRLAAPSMFAAVARYTQHTQRRVSEKGP